MYIEYLVTRQGNTEIVKNKIIKNVCTSFAIHYIGDRVHTHKLNIKH